MRMVLFEIPNDTVIRGLAMIYAVLGTPDPDQCPTLAPLMK